MVERAFPARLSPDAGAGGVVAPFQFIATGEDNLRLRTWSTNDQTTDPATVELGLRMIDAAGQLQVTTVRQTVTQPVVFADTVIPLGVGALVNVAVRYLPQGYPTGATYVVVELVRGAPPGAVTLIGQMLGDYVNAGKALAWPGSPIRSWSEGSGFQRRYVTSFGAPGAEGGKSVQTPFAFKPLVYVGTLICSAAAATRFPALVFRKPTGVTDYIVRCPCPIAPTAGVGVEITWAVGYGAVWTGVAPRYTAPMPTGLILSPGDEIETNTIGLQAGDAWVTSHIWVEELVFPQGI